MTRPEANPGGHRAAQEDHFSTDAAARDAENEGRGRTYSRKGRILGQRLQRATSILEVGCGSGFFTNCLARALPDSLITATDAFEPVLARARSRVTSPNVRFLAFDAESDVDAQELGGPFDAICGVDILHHLERPIDALATWRGVVKPGGSLALLESNPKNPVLFARLFGRPAERRVFLNTRGNLEGWSRAAGWSDVVVEYAPLYLPNGPQPWWPRLAFAEEVLHALRVLRPLSGLFLVQARRMD